MNELLRAFPHIYPQNDLIEHVTDAECPCVPTIHVDDDGLMMIMHNAQDGRDA